MIRYPIDFFVRKVLIVAIYHQAALPKVLYEFSNRLLYSIKSNVTQFSIAWTQTLGDVFSLEGRLQRKHLLRYLSAYIQAMAPCIGIMTHNGSADRNVHLNEVLSFVPSQRCGEEPCPFDISSESTKSRVICIQNDLISPRRLNSHTVVCETLCGMKVEDPQQSSPLEYNHFVLLVFQANIRLIRVEPAILLLGPLHLAVKVVEKLISKQIIVREIELPPSIPVAVVITIPWEIQPFWVAKFVSLKIEISFTSKPVRDKSYHLMQTQASFDDRCEY